jgi:hypothetical protein
MSVGKAHAFFGQLIEGRGADAATFLAVAFHISNA